MSTEQIKITNVESMRELAEFIVALVGAVIIFACIWVHYAKAYPAFCSHNKQNMTHQQIEMIPATDVEQETENLTTNNKQNDSKEQKDFDEPNPELIHDSSILALLTCFSMLFYFLSCFYSALIKGASEQLSFCQGFIIPILWCFTIGRTFQFTLYIARLDYLYGNYPSFGYKKSTLMILATAVFVVALALLSMQSAYGLESVIYQNFEDFPHFCAFKVDSKVLIFMLVFDISITITSLVLFYVPLRKIRAEKNQETKDQLASYGKKYALVVLVNAIFNLVSYVVLITTHNAIIAPLNNMIGAWCVMLLSPYYPKISKALGIGTVDEIGKTIKKR